MKTRIIHIRVPELSTVGGHAFTTTPAAKGGATIIIEPIEGRTDSVAFYPALCSRHDNFCRKTGRDVASQELPLTVRVQDIAMVLQDVQQFVFKRCKVAPIMKQYAERSFMNIQQMFEVQ